MKNSAKFLRLLVFVSLSCLGGWTAYSQTSKTPFVPPPLDSIETNSGTSNVFDPSKPFTFVGFRPKSIAEAQLRYQEDARTNQITLDKPQYTSAPWSEIRLRASALKGDGLAASLCSGSNSTEQLFWLSLAATNGWIPSQVRLAKDYEYERPKDTKPGGFTWEEVDNPELEEIEKSPKAAQFWWSKAKAGLPKLKDDATRNDARAIYALGLLHESGALVESNAVLAAEMFHKAAASGLPPAQESWGSYCDWHLTNRVEAANWCYQAATQGLMSAQSFLSFLHEKPSEWRFNPHFQPKARERARWTFEEASQPITCFQTYWACGELGELYLNGLGIESNAVEAVRWYRRASDLGIINGSVEYNLARHYYNGDGLDKDYAKAAKWFRKAAEKGNATAQFYLGLMYYNGEGVPQDYAEAAKWYRKAADQGRADAENNLGVMYRNGQGVPQDYVEAYKWYNLAAAQGETNAISNRGGIASSMTLEQIAEAQRLSHGDLLNQIAADSQQNRSTPVESKPRFDWGLVLGVALLLLGVTALAACVILAWRLKKRIGAQKFILFCGVVLFVFCGLFPPWLYISDRGHTRSAGYSFILSAPPDARLDISRLAVEWLCIAVATGTVWLLVSKPEKKKDSKDN